MRHVVTAIVTIVAISPLHVESQEPESEQVIVCSQPRGNSDPNFSCGEIHYELEVGTLDYINVQELLDAEPLDLSDESIYPTEFDQMLSAVRDHVEELGLDPSELSAFPYCGEEYCYVDVYPNGLDDEVHKEYAEWCPPSFCATVTFSRDENRILTVQRWE